VPSPEDVEPEVIVIEQNGSPPDSIYYDHPLQICGQLADGTRIAFTFNSSEAGKLFLSLRDSRCVQSRVEDIEYMRANAHRIDEPGTSPDSAEAIIARMQARHA
jgi:hypothetical protein